MKRTVSIVLIVFLLLGLLAACGKAGREAPAPEELPAARRSTDRAAWDRPGQEEALKETEPPEETPSVPDSAEPPSETKTPDLSGIRPLLWKVSDAEGHVLYLFGTIHVGDERNQLVLSQIAPVLDSCDALAVEFDLVAYAEDTQRAMQDMMQYMLSDGSTIQDYMPEELYQRSYALLQEAGLFPGLFSRYNLAMWSQLIDSGMILVYGSLVSDYGMDDLLIHRAYELEKPVLDVESSDFQMALLNSFEDELYLLLIEATLDSAGSYDAELTRMYELWLSGDRDGFWSLLADEDEEGSDGGYTEDQLRLLEDYNRKMLDDRNLGMRDRAEEYLSSGQTVFFAVGAAHMANETGLVRLLTDAGYSVESVDYVS